MRTRTREAGFSVRLERLVRRLGGPVGSLIADYDVLAKSPVEGRAPFCVARGAASLGPEAEVRSA